MKPNSTALRPWSPEELELVRTKWGEGFSASEIACLLPGRTRASVIGQVHRSSCIRNRDAGRVIVRRPRTPASLRKMVATRYANLEPAPISLPGPVWSLPANARPASKAAERRAAA